MNEELRQLNARDRAMFLADPNMKVLVAEDFAEGKITSVEDAMQLYGITRYQALSLMSDPIIIDAMKKITTARLQIAYNTTVVDTVLTMLKGDDDKAKLGAMNMIAKMTGNVKGGGTDLNVHLSLEGMVKQVGNKEVSGDSELDKMFNSPIIDIKD